MKARTPALLQQMLDDDLQWRIKELSNFRNSIPRELGSAQNALIRGGVTLLYAHWEGFIKNATLQYYRFVSCQSHYIGEFSSAFIAFILSGEVNDLLSIKSVHRKRALLDKILGEMQRPATFPSRSPIVTSNLHYDQFEDACSLLNIPIADFQLSADFIDNQLVKRRNSIAHGNYLDIDYRTFNEELYPRVRNLLSQFKDKVVVCAIDKQYLR